MVARDVREGARREAHTVEAVLVKAVARGFDCEVGHAVGHQRRQIFVKRDRVGCRMREHRLPFARHNSDRAEARSLKAGRGPDLTQKSRNRCLAVRTRDGRDDFGLRGVKASGKVSERLPCLCRMQDRYAERVRLCTLPARTATAPRAKASPTKAMPSAFVPESATNNMPGATSRLSAVRPVILISRGILVLTVSGISLIKSANLIGVPSVETLPLSGSRLFIGGCSGFVKPGCGQDVEHGSDPLDNRARGWSGVLRSFVDLARFLRLRFVDRHHHHVLGRIDRESRHETVDHVVGVMTILHLERRSGLSADGNARRLLRAAPCPARRQGA